MNIKDCFTRPVFSGEPGTKKKTALGIKLLICAVILSAVIYAMFAPSTFVMANGYMLYPADTKANTCMLKEPGGRILAHGNLYFAGKYPWLTGWDGDGKPLFLLNLEDHTFSKIPQDMTDGEFARFCDEHNYTFSSALSWNDLYPAEDTEETRARRVSFKAGLQKRQREL